MTNIAILVSNACFASTVHSLLDAFFSANYVGADISEPVQISTALVSLDGKPVTSLSGHLICVDHSIQNLPDQDVIIVAPAISPFATQPEIEQSFKPLGPLSPWLISQAERGVILASSCTGSFLLAESGLLNGRVATTHWRAAQAFSKRYPEVVLKAKELITEDGSMLCGGGAVSCVDLALHLIRRIGGVELAARCAQILVVDPARDLQSPYARFHSNRDHQDQLITQAQDDLQRNYWKKLNIEKLAESLFVSERTLKRRFSKAAGVSIGQYLQSIRIEAARDRLTSTGYPLQTIVSDVGYEDLSSFSRLFKRTTGLTMKTYRERFSSPEVTG